MRIRTLSAVLLAVVLPISSCSDSGLLDPAPAPVPLFNHAETAPPEVRISEIHYDNASTDAGEAIEISGPTGFDVTGWKIQLYNGANGAAYTPIMTLAGTIPDTPDCGDRGVKVTNYGLNGLQNGNPDGLALVNAAGHVVEFLSYGGSFTAVGGPADGMTSVNLPVQESGSTPVGHSLQRRGTGANVWEGPQANTFNACNDNDTPPPPPAVVARVEVTPETATVEQGDTQQFSATAYDAADQPVAGIAFTWTSSDPSASVNASGLATGEGPGDALIIATTANGTADTAALHVDPTAPPPAVRFSEIHYDNFDTDFGEAIEVEGPAGTDLTGWSIVLYNGSGGAKYSETALDGLIPATTACSGRGVIYVTYPSNGIQNGSPDGFALVDGEGNVIEFLSYEGTFAATDGPAAGKTSKDIVAFQASAPVGQSLQRNTAGTSWASAAASFGVCNGSGVTPPPFANSISFSGRVPADPALPVGFEDQIFATLRDGSGTVVPTTFTWTSETPAIASVDQDGVMRALSAGTAVLRATAEDGTTRTYSLPTHVATASSTADYDGNAEFGEPEDATPADELIIRRNQLITSFNPGKGTPNWVAYEIDASHFGPEDRCDCFTYDPELPPAAKYTTADYTGAGTFHGYGIDRGHLARSFDRTAGSLDNAHTYYFSNIIPQAADNNQGPWAQLESYLGNLAQSGAKEVYVIAGPQGNKGTVKNEGRIVIPENTWKVAVIMPKDQGIEHVDSYDDVEVIAVILPNEAGIRNVAWQNYMRTVDQVEALTGYDLLALLRDDIEIAVESNTAPPVAAVDGPYTAIEEEAVSMSAAMSSDPDGDALTFAWSFGDGGTATGVNVSHTYTSGGTFTVRLIATDTRALADTVTTTAAIATWSQATGSAGAIVGQLASAGKLRNGVATSLRAKLDAAESQFERGNNATAVNQLAAFVNELDALIQSGRLSAADAAQLRTLVTRIIAAAS
jgi:DNA/RNA endonuclease G (NUC1)